MVSSPNKRSKQKHVWLLSAIKSKPEEKDFADKLEQLRQEIQSHGGYEGDGNTRAEAGRMAGSRGKGPQEEGGKGTERAKGGE